MVVSPRRLRRTPRPRRVPVGGRKAICVSCLFLSGQGSGAGNGPNDTDRTTAQVRPTYFHPKRVLREPHRGRVDHGRSRSDAHPRRDFRRGMPLGRRGMTSGSGSPRLSEYVFLLIVCSFLSVVTALHRSGASATASAEAGVGTAHRRPLARMPAVALVCCLRRHQNGVMDKFLEMLDLEGRQASFARTTSGASDGDLLAT